MEFSEYTYRWEDVPPERLERDFEVQRETDPKRVEKIAANWSPIQAGSVVVAEVDGRLWCVDGFHRREAAIIVRAKVLHALIVEDLDKQGQARLFLSLQRDRKGVSAETQFRVSLVAGEVRETQIQAVLGPRGLRVGGSPSYTTIAAVKGLCRMYDTAVGLGLDGQVLIAETIDILRGTWSASEGGDLWQTDLLQGVGRVIMLNPGLDRHRLIDILASRKPRVWVADAQMQSRGSGGSGGRPVHLAAVLANAYNKGLRGRTARLRSRE